MVTDNHI